MKTFADCKIGDEIYIVLSTSYKIEKITKISDDRFGLLRIHTENYILDCPKDNEKHFYMFCTRGLAIKQFKQDIAWHQKQIDAIQEAIKDLSEI